MKHLVFTVLAAMLIVGGASAQRLRVGVRGGINAVDYKFVPTTINGVRFSPGSAHVGYEAGFVVRLNLTKHLHLQSELNYNFINYNILADGAARNYLKLKTQRLEIPVQLGLQFGMFRLFGGASFRVAHSERSNIPRLLEVDYNDQNVAVMGGIGLNIRKFFIDFRVQGYPRSRVWNTFTSNGISARVKVPHEIVYGGSLGFFF